MLAPRISESIWSPSGPSSHNNKNQEFQFCRYRDNASTDHNPACIGSNLCKKPFRQQVLDETGSSRGQYSFYEENFFLRTGCRKHFEASAILFRFHLLSLWKSLQCRYPRLRVKKSNLSLKPIGMGYVIRVLSRNIATPGKTDQSVQSFGQPEIVL